MRYAEGGALRQCASTDWKVACSTPTRRLPFVENPPGHALAYKKAYKKRPRGKETSEDVRGSVWLFIIYLNRGCLDK